MHSIWITQTFKTISCFEYDSLGFFLAVDNVHDKKVFPIFYIIERLQFYAGIGSGEIRFILTARVPEYNNLFAKGLIDIEQEAYRDSIIKMNDPNFKYVLPFFTQEEIVDFIRKYREYLELSAEQEKSLSNHSEEIYQETKKGHPMLVKFYTFRKGLQNDMRNRYANYLIDRKTQTPDSLKIQTALVCSLFDIAGLQINDRILENMKLKKYAKALHSTLLYNHPDGTWETLHQRWDIEFLSFLYNVDENGIDGNNNDESVEYLKNAIELIFGLKDENITAAVIEVMYRLSSYHIDGVNKIPVDLVENVIEGQIPDYLSKEVKSTLYARIAFDYIDLEKYAKALEYSKKALEIDPNSIPGWIGTGLYHDHLGRYDEAIEDYNKAIDIDPKNDTALNNKGLTLYHLGRYDEAYEYHKKAIELNPNNDATWDNKGLDLDSMGKYDEAIQSYDKAIEINSENYHTWTNLGWSLNNLGKYDEAIEVVNMAIAINPKHKYAWNVIGAALYNLKRYDEAIENYNKAIDIDPKYASALVNKGNALNSLGRYKEAIISYTKALDIDPEDANAWYNKGIALDNLGRYEDAIKCYDEALGIDSDQVSALDGKGYALFKLGQDDEAIKCSNEAIEKAPNYANAWYNRAIYKIHKEDIENGLLDLNKAIDIGGEEYIESAMRDSDFEGVRNNEEFQKILASKSK